MPEGLEEVQVGQGKRFRSRFWTGLIPIAISFVFMAGLSWRKWADPLVDFGMQLYIPWKLSTGSLLYRDIAHLPGGPLSQYFNAFLFKIFGPSFDILIAANLSIAIGFLILVYSAFFRFADRITAVWIGLAIATVFTFSQFIEGAANYNFIAPYAHEAWHGLVLSVCLVALLTKWIQTGGTRWVRLSGFFFGLIFLIKAEVFLAAAAVTIAAFVFRSLTLKIRISKLVIDLGNLFLAAVLPLLGFWIFFLSCGLDFFESARSTVWAWVPLITTNVAKTQFYRWGLGLDTPLHHIKIAILCAGIFSALVVLCIWRCSKGNKFERLIWFAAAGAGSLYLDWTQSGRLLPFLMLVTAFFIWRRYKNSQPQERQRLFFPALWIVLSLFLLSKMGLYTRIFHYGIFLACPAFLGAIYFLVYLLPAEIRQSKGASSSFRSIMLLFLFVGFIRLIVVSGSIYMDKDFTLGTGRDRFIVVSERYDETGPVMASILSWIQENSNPTNTLAALPEGAMLNYLSRRSNPTPYPVFMAELAAFGEQRMLRAYQKDPPDLVAVVHRTTWEYGYNYFGTEAANGKATMKWVYENYRPVFLAGSEPLKSQNFGIKLLERIPEPLGSRQKKLSVDASPRSSAPVF